MSVRKRLLQTTMLAGIVGSIYLSTNARAEDIATAANAAAFPPVAAGPAVDGVNGKLEGAGGSLAGNSLYGVKGSLSVPLGGPWGVQIDGAGGSFDGSGFGNIAGHFFWRDPAHGLLGLYATTTHWDRFGGVDRSAVAGEGEYYWGRWNFHGIAGVEFGNSATRTTTTKSGGTTTTLVETYDIKTRFFDETNLAYYLTDDWNAYVGHRYLGGKHALALGSEYALPLGHGTMASVFAEARVGEGDFHGIWGGLRFYFGQKDKPLIARHRQDDPTIWDTLPALSNTYNSNTSTSSTCPAGYYLLDGYCYYGPL
jgi:hypothetical protein